VIPPLPTGTGRVNVMLEVETTREEPEQLALAVSEWLFKNVYRPGVPYMIDRATIKYDKQRSEIAKEAESNAGTPQIPTGGGFTPPPGTGGKSGGRVVGGAGPDERGGMQVGGAPPSTAPNAQAVEQLAPLPKPAPLGKPGTTLYKYIFHWDAVIMPDAPAAEGKS
jgi:hypothetical protein